MEEVIPSPHAMETPTSLAVTLPRISLPLYPIGKMMRRHGSNGNRQSKRESIAKHPEDEDVSQFAHLKNAPPSSAGFF
jgi:hypothetical protein